jgi:hypothetical protein
MKIFIYEYVCGGGLAGQPLPESLAREGWAMLSSVVEDFAYIAGCEVVTSVDDRLAGRSLAAQHVERLGEAATCLTEAEPSTAERRLIARLAAESDWSLIIAPETRGVLFDRVRWVEQAGGRLLGPASSAVALTADKLHCAELLQQAGVPTVASETVDLAELSRRLHELRFPFVIKPRDGAGSQATFLIRDRMSLDSAVDCARREAAGSEFLLQPYVQGTAVSASFLIGPHGATPLVAGEQLFGNDDRFHYRGGRMPLESELTHRALALARRAVTLVPGLRGYVGVDMVLAREQDVVIEINPRLTTSYIGLRALCKDNLARRMVQIVTGDCEKAIAWRAAMVGFRADGRVAYREAGPGSLGSSA